MISCFFLCFFHGSNAPICPIYIRVIYTPLILTIDPNFQRDIQMGKTCAFCDPRSHFKARPQLQHGYPSPWWHCSLQESHCCLEYPWCQKIRIHSDLFFGFSNIVWGPQKDHGYHKVKKVSVYSIDRPKRKHAKVE